MPQIPQIPPSTALPAVRIALGAGSYAAPALVGKGFGFRETENQETLYLARLFGVRDAVLAVGVLTSRGPAQKQWWKLGIVCDAADAVAGVLGYRAGAPKRAMITSTATALVAVGLGIAALRE